MALISGYLRAALSEIRLIIFPLGLILESILMYSARSRRINGQQKFGIINEFISRPFPGKPFAFIHYNWDSISPFFHALRAQQEVPNIDQMNFMDRLGLLVDHEVTTRENVRVQSRLRRANLRQSGVWKTWTTGPVEDSISP